MRIATKTFIVVFVSLAGALFAVSAVFYSYQALEQLQEERESAELAARDMDHMNTALGQWFTTIDLFFGEQQSHLAQGIEHQAKQLAKILTSTEVSVGQVDEASSVIDQITILIEDVQQQIAEAALSTQQQGREWNQLIESVDNKTVLILEQLDALDLLISDFHRTKNEKFERAKRYFYLIVQLSIVIYLAFSLLAWLWASRNITRPVEKLIALVSSIKEGEKNDFLNQVDGPKEIILLGGSLQKFSDNLYNEKRKVEARTRQVQQKNSELEDRLDELNKTRLQLVQAEKMASVGQLAAGVAHEINNPVGFISSNLSTLRKYIVDLNDVMSEQVSFISNLEDKGHEKAKELAVLYRKSDMDFVLEDIDSLVEECIEGTQRVKSIVADLSEFSHVNSPELVEEDINALLDKTVSVSWNEIKYKCRVEKNYSDIPKVLCNGGKIAQAFLNLIINASHAMEDQGVLTLATGHVDNYVWVEIKDNGCGIPEDKLNKIFDPFFTTKDVGQGTGLGLHIVQSVLESHGGRVSVTSTEGVGTLFRLILPIEAESVEQ